MKSSIRPIFCLAAILCLSSCGDGSGGGNQAVTYALITESQPTISQEGSFIGTKIPLQGAGGLVADIGLTGTFDVVSDTPPAGVQLNYRVVRVDFVPLNPQVSGIDEISAEGEALGHLQLLDDGTVTMNLTVPIFGMTFELGNYDQRVNRYEMEDGRLLLRGMRLQTPFDEPFFGTPLLYLWADPVSD